MRQSDIGDRLQSIAPGIHRFDTHYVRPGHTSCYIVVETGRAALVDCGVAANASDLLAALAAMDVAPEAVDHLILTHVHLDHAGAAGQLMGMLPSARLAVHPSGAPHMVDPMRLEAGVRALYGDIYFRREYGELLPIEVERVDETPDLGVVQVGGRELVIIHTPGHAWHHQSILDPATATVIAGDAFGVGYREIIGDDGPFILPVVPPPQFKPEVYRKSVDRIVGLTPKRVAPTHFDVLTEPARIAADLHRRLDAGLRACWQASSVEDLERRLVNLYVTELERRGRGDAADLLRELYGMDIWLTAEGMWVWRRKQEERKANAAGVRTND